SDLNTNAYLINVIGSSIPLWSLPSIVFVVSSIISFATGTSYGTMGIFFPLVTPLAISLLNNAGLEAISASGYNNIFLGVIGAVFAGALFGDHCSPISDTTTMSSLSTGSDLIDHFSSQLVYGLVVLAVSVLCGFLLIGFGVNPFISIFIGIISMFIILRLFGKKVA
ncbi:MAG: Na+/H+ antiporter NhaC family protein, partial [Candidatus Sericytochromatia bacterium]